MQHTLDLSRHIKNYKKSMYIILSLCSGILNAQAFSIISHYYCAIFALTINILLWSQSKTPSHAALLGWLYGITFFLLGLSWVQVPLHVFGGLSTNISWALTLVLVTFLACFPAAQAACLQYLWPHTRLTQRLLLYPLSLMAIEQIRVYCTLGFPWLIQAHALTNSHLLSYASILGESGCSALIAFIAILIYCVLDKPSWQRATVSSIALLIISYGGHYLTQHPWTRDEKTVSIASVQGNLPTIFDPSYETYNNLGIHLKLSQPYWGKNDVVIWPEGTLYDPNPHQILTLTQTARPQHTTLITGVTHISQTHQEINAIQAFGASQGYYIKQKLVPFGEYIPWPGLIRPLIQWLDVIQPDFIAGPANQPTIHINNWKLATLICYEIAFEAISLENSRNSNLIAVLSNDVWFGKTHAPFQHLQIAQFRAAEVQKSIAFNANSGITAMINPNGTLLAQTTLDTTTVLSGQLPLRSGYTPITQLSSYSLLLWTGCFYVLLTLIIHLSRRKTSR